MKKKYQKMRGTHLTDIFKTSRLASTNEDLIANKTEWVLSNRSQRNKSVRAKTNKGGLKYIVELSLLVLQTEWEEKVLLNKF